MIEGKNDNHLEADAGLDQTISEGSLVFLNGHGTTAKTDHEKVSYSWSQVSPENYDVSIAKPNSSNPIFKAPYIIDDSNNGHVKRSITLRFQLVVSDNKGISSKSYVNIRVKRVQRAIIFQAGVALGAYEAGVFQALVKMLAEEHRSKGLEERPLFDIVAGASIGAMNAAVVVSNAIKSKSWEHSAEELVRFWRYQEFPRPTVADTLDINPIYHWSWDTLHVTNNVLKKSAGTLTESIFIEYPYFKEWYDLFMGSFYLEPDYWKDFFIDGWYIPATAEAARRYYSSYECKHLGAPHVASGITPWFAFGKFFDFTDDLNFLPKSFRPDNKHITGYSLKKTLENFADFPIRTDKPDPRFLLVTVDVQTGDAVTFDSYEKKERGNSLVTNHHHSEYGDEQDKHIIFYDRGIEIEHVLASGTFPDFFDYPKIRVSDTKTGIQNEHIFWDGSLRSTTPLREVIQAHRDYWHKPDTSEDDVPDLEVYIADLWPSLLKEEPTSFDRDFVENRKWNILFSDKTDYDEQVAKVVTDYNDVVKKLKNLAEKNGIPSHEIRAVLKNNASSKNRNRQTRTYHDLLGGRFRLTKVVRIDRKDDGNEVHDKIFDYSRTTIEKLMEMGYYDALIKIAEQSINDGIIEIENKTNRGLEDKVFEQLRQTHEQINHNLRFANGHDSMIISQIEDFAYKVESIKDDVGTDRSIKEEKAHLIGAAEQIKKIVIERKNLNVNI